MSIPTAAPTNQHDQPHDVPFSRVARNVGWMAGARGFTGILSIFYLAVAARTLGLREFGNFALILSFGQLVATLVQFQSVKGVIRFGAMHLSDNRPDRLPRLYGYMTTLELLGIVIGSGLAFACMPLVAPLYQWTEHQQLLASIFAVALLFGTGGTPVGILRLYGRFDLISYTEGVGPIIRLVGVSIAWWVGAGIGTFLAIWALAVIAQTAAQWIASIVALHIRLEFGKRAIRTTLAENHKLWRFMVLTNVSNSVTAVWTELGTLAVGAVAGPVQAGGFRIAQRIAKAIGNPVELVTRALFPEFAKLVAQNAFRRLGRMLIRITAVATALAAVTVAILALGGQWIIGLIAGPQYEFAYIPMLLLSVATAIDLASFALDPYHIAQGRAGRILRIRLVAAGVYLIVLAVLLPRFGASGAAIAGIAASIILFVQLGISSWQILRDKAGRGSAQDFQ